VSCCINRRKPVPERTDRGGTLRYAWLRAPPLHRMQKNTSKPRLGCLTQKPSYEGGQRSVSDVPTLYHQARFWMVGTLSVAVGTLIAERPPHRTVRAAFPHTAPTSGV
jgi:hypothetical protein